MKKTIFAIALLLAPSLSWGAAGQGFSTWTALAPATLADGDLFGVTDVSDTSGSDDGTSKKVLASAIKSYILPATLVGDCTVGPCLDGTSDGGNLIKLYAGSGSYWTALQSGVPAANRSWRLPTLAPPSAGETNVMTMDENGQMNFLDKPGTTGYVLSSTDAGVLSWVANTDDQTAAEVNITDTGSYYTGTTVEAALQEIGANFAAMPNLSAGAGITITEDGGGAGIDTIAVTANTYQAYDADLTTYAGITPSSNVQSLLGAANYAAMRTLLDLEAGTDFNAYDDDLADLADGSLTGSKVSAASDTAVGVVELAIASEINTGTDTGKAVTPDALAGSSLGSKEIGWVIVKSDTVTAVADGKDAIAIPSSMNGMNLVDVTCSVSDLNSAASGTTTVVLRRVRGATAVDMTSTGVTIGYNEYTASDETVDTSNDDVQTGDKIFADVNAVTTAVHKGLYCTAVFQLP